jgi:hemerythrin-like domain-containing protein
MEELLKQFMEQMNKRFDQVDQRFEKIDQRMDNLEKNVKDLKVGQDQLKDNLIHGLGPYFEQIKKHVDAKTGEIKETLEDQQRIIDTLSARSIKHESEIKDFKRMLKNQ